MCTQAEASSASKVLVKIARRGAMFKTRSQIDWVQAPSQVSTFSEPLRLFRDAGQCALSGICSEVAASPLVDAGHRLWSDTGFRCTFVT